MIMMMRRLSVFIASIALCCPISAAVKDYVLKVQEKYPHDGSAYTQGLFFHDGTMYESTGQYGQSSVRIVDYRTGKVVKSVRMAARHFGEGSCIVDGKLYVLTWKNKMAFIYDPATLKCLKTLSYPRDGWGLTGIPEDARKDFAGAVMVASDGSSSIYFLDRKLSTLKSVTVKLNGRPMRLLNELEWIDGKIWANVYTTDLILIIDPATGNVIGKMDCSSLIPQDKRTPSMDVLNGIAVRHTDKGEDEIFLTGKNWPWMFRVSVSER